MLDMDFYSPRVCLTWYNWEKKQGWSVDFSKFQDLLFSKHLISTFLSENCWVFFFIGVHFSQAGKITAEEKETLIRCPPDPNPPAMPENARMGWVVVCFFQGWNLPSREWCHKVPPNEKKENRIHSKVSFWEENMLLPLCSTSFFCDGCQPRVVFFRIMFSYRWSII